MRACIQGYVSLLKGFGLYFFLPKIRFLMHINSGKKILFAHWNRKRKVDVQNLLRDSSPNGQDTSGSYFGEGKTCRECGKYAIDAREFAEPIAQHTPNFGSRPFSQFAPCEFSLQSGERKWPGSNLKILVLSIFISFARLQEFSAS